MNLVKTCLFVAAVCECLANNASAIAADSKYWTKVYDETSEVQDAKGTSLTSRIVSDGKGRVLNQSTTALGETSTILNYTSKTMAIVLNTPQKVVLLMPLDDSKLLPATPGDRKNIKDLGEQTIAGHPCKGESFTTGKSKVEIWTGTDVGYPVKTTVEQAGAKITTVLKSYSTNTPSPKLFLAPTDGYQLLKKDK